ncbi:Grixazone synthase [Podospora australis]|uniref:Grixazone synthase n=1 Tax=Podospora australis TaxID=1536484 RepID=A0AAN6WHS3_9PEZI|nr:Grixazone synthase [Podospora australis]
MKLTTTFLLAFLPTGLSTPLAAANFLQSAIDNGLALKTLNSLAVAKAFTKFKGQCNPLKVKYRREFRSLSKSERRKFVKAVQCLQSKPSLLPPGLVPASHSIYDDLIFAHANRTGFVHQTATFLLFHRYYLQTYEDALEKYCGWKGALPYWEWGLDIAGPHLSPLFDGSDASLGSDGTYIPNRPPLVFNLTGPAFEVPPGTGGGCVHTGPFSDQVVRLGPFPSLATGLNFPLDESGLVGNPRCLDRDLNSYSIEKWASFKNTTELILHPAHRTIKYFQANADPDFRVLGADSPLVMGPHGGGHSAIGGIARDPAISPTDPAFWLTHAQLDRIYFIWQYQDFENRNDVYGTNTWFNIPPSNNVTVEDSIDIEPFSPSRKLKDLVNTISGAPFCYVYL